MALRTKTVTRGLARRRANADERGNDCDGDLRHRAWLGGPVATGDSFLELAASEAADNGKPGPETLVTVTLTERGSKTEMSFRQTGFDSVESSEGHAGGWNECFDKLDELLSESRRNR